MTKIITSRNVKLPLKPKPLLNGDIARLLVILHVTLYIAGTSAKLNPLNEFSLSRIMQVPRCLEKKITHPWQRRSRHDHVAFHSAPCVATWAYTLACAVARASAAADATATTRRLVV